MEKTCSALKAAVDVPEQWQEAANAIVYDSSSSPPPIALVCGPGNAGKSTFSRILLNTFLLRYKRVGYLDTDVGQPEFTTPGCISLHIIDKPTPDLGTIYMKTPERCFFFGDISATRDPESHLNCIIRLFDHFINQYYQKCELDNPRMLTPLVVNTSGWIKGTGFEMLVKMLKHMSPTHVVQICTSAASKNLPKGIFWLEEQNEAMLQVIEISAMQDISTRPSQMKKDSRDIRDIRFIAYFRQCLPRELEFASCNHLVRSLASIHPFKIPISRIKVKHLHSKVSSNEVDSLNASIVGLAIRSSIPASNKHDTPWCVGLGFIQSVDKSKDQIFIVTPVPLCTLEKVDILLQGNIDVPVCLLQASRSSFSPSGC